MTNVDVIRFGERYCIQNSACEPILDEVFAEAREREFSHPGAARAYVTRKLRESGLVVATACAVRALWL